MFEQKRIPRIFTAKDSRFLLKIMFTSDWEAAFRSYSVNTNSIGTLKFENSVENRSSQTLNNRTITEWDCCCLIFSWPINPYYREITEKTDSYRNDLTIVWCYTCPYYRSMSMWNESECALFLQFTFTISSHSKTTFMSDIS